MLIPYVAKHMLFKIIHWD